MASRKSLHRAQRERSVAARDVDSRLDGALLDNGRDRVKGMIAAEVPAPSK
jgi:hypothetical protein